VRRDTAQDNGFRPSAGTVLAAIAVVLLVMNAKDLLRYIKISLYAVDERRLGDMVGFCCVYRSGIDWKYYWRHRAFCPDRLCPSEEI
jgi:hypothetical protein